MPLHRKVCPINRPLTFEKRDESYRCSKSGSDSWQLGGIPNDLSTNLEALKAYSALFLYLRKRWYDLRNSCAWRRFRSYSVNEACAHLYEYFLFILMPAYWSCLSYTRIHTGSLAPNNALTLTCTTAVAFRDCLTHSSSHHPRQIRNDDTVSSAKNHGHPTHAARILGPPHHTKRQCKVAIWRSGTSS